MIYMTSSDIFDGIENLQVQKLKKNFSRYRKISELRGDPCRFSFKSLFPSSGDHSDYVLMTRKLHP